MEFSQDVNELKSKYEDDELNTHFVELLTESAYLDMSEYRESMKHLESALEEYSLPLQGDDAVAHDLLLDELEKFTEEQSGSDNENKELVEEI